MAVSLLWGERDFVTATGRAVMAGWDTDSNAATVGSVAGVIPGTQRIPHHLVEPIGDRTGSALFG